jgi:prepilin-type N-terminal cleavage/methylation domain-containing protein
MPTADLRARTVSRARRAGFTLIELLAVILIIGILMTFLLPKIPEAIDRTEVVACKANLSEIYKGLLIYNDKHRDLPKQSGVKFFASLIADGVWENSKSSAERLSCPGVKTSSLAGIAEVDDPTQWYEEIDAVDGSYSAYAGRNMKEYPLRKFPGSAKEALVADDNDPEGNHRTTTLVLFADGSVGTFELRDEIKKGTLTEDDPTLVVGPDSPIDELRKLSAD